MGKGWSLSCLGKKKKRTGPEGIFLGKNPFPAHYSTAPHDHPATALEVRSATFRHVPVPPPIDLRAFFWTHIQRNMIGQGKTLYDGKCMDSSHGSPNPSQISYSIHLSAG